MNIIDQVGSYVTQLNADLEAARKDLEAAVVERNSIKYILQNRYFCCYFIN